MSQTEEQRSQITEYNRQQLTIHQGDLSNVELPQFFAIYRHDVPDQRVRSEASHWLAALVTAERCPNTRTQWRFHIMRDPIDTIDVASVYIERNDRWLGDQSHGILVQKLSRDLAEHGRLVYTRVKFNNVVISVTGADQQIPCLEISEALRILPRQFQELGTSSRYAHYGFHLRPTEPIIRNWTNMMEGVQLRDPAAILARIDQRILQRNQQAVDGVAASGGFFQGMIARRQQREGQQLQPQPTAPPAPVAQAQPTMPQHVVNTFIDAEIARGTVCPISQEPLTRDTACLTPCGHVYSFDEVAHWIQGGHSCPECRAACSVAQLQRWSAR